MRKVDKSKKKYGKNIMMEIVAATSLPIDTD